MPMTFLDGLSVTEIREIKDLVKKLYIGRIDDTVPRGSSQQLQKLFEETSFKNRKALKEKYEFISRASVKNSRLRLSDLFNEEAVAIRFYGRFGGFVNFYTNKLYNLHPSRMEPSLEQSGLRVERLMHDFNIFSPRDIFKNIVSDDKIKKTLLNIFKNKDPLLATSLTVYIDRIIERYAARYNPRIEVLNRGYLYRVGETLNDEVRAQHAASETVPGDVLLPASLWSTSFDSDAVLFRYSRAGQMVTKAASVKAGASSGGPTSTREVLYAIENNEYLKKIDVSGFKVRRPSEIEDFEVLDANGRVDQQLLMRARRRADQDKFSSGEHLIKSRTPFRVIAVQDRTADLERQIIVLRPVPKETIDLRRDVIKDPFTMAPNASLLAARLAAEAQDQHVNFRPVNPPLVQKLKPIETVKPIGLDSASASVSALSLGELSEGEKQDKTKKKFKEEAEGEGEGLEELAELI